MTVPEQILLNNAQNDRKQQKKNDFFMAKTFLGPFYGLISDRTGCDWQEMGREVGRVLDLNKAALRSTKPLWMCHMLCKVHYKGTSSQGRFELEIETYIDCWMGLLM